MDEKMLECRSCGTRKWSVLEERKSKELQATGFIRLPCASCGGYMLWKESDYDWRGRGGKESIDSTRKPSLSDSMSETQFGKLGVQRDTSVTTVSEQAASAPSSPVDFRMHSRRKHERVPLQLPLRIRVDTPALQFSDVLKCINVSRTGIYFRSDRPYRQGLKVFVVLSYSPKNTSVPIEHPAIVIRLESIAENSAQGVALMLI